MEEQERERAMNGGSAINLPNIAASLREAATPRSLLKLSAPSQRRGVTWRKGRDPGSISSISGVLSSLHGKWQQLDTIQEQPVTEHFPRRALGLARIRTPPDAASRSAAPACAFSATGRRFTAQDLANRPKPASPHAREADAWRASPRGPVQPR